MDNKKIAKSCATCKFFYQHYVKCETKFMTTNCGHCFNRNLTPKEKRSFPFLNGCDFWEQQETNIEEQNKTIKSIISAINKRLEKIYDFLNSD